MFKEEKIISHYKKLEDLSLKKIVNPVTVSVNLTSEMYPHCSCQRPSDWNVLPRKDMPLDEAIRIVTDLSKNNIQSIIFNGKYDVLGYNKIDELLEIVKNNGKIVGLVTDGSNLVGHAYCVKRTCNIIWIDYNSGIAKTYAEMHKDDVNCDSFEQSLQSIKHIKKNNKKILLIGRFTPNFKNYKEITEFVKNCKIHGIDRTEILYQDENLDDNAKNEIEKQIKECEKEYVDFIDASDYKFFNSEKSNKRYVMKSYSFPLSISIGSNSNIYIPVKNFRTQENIIGNYKGNNFVSIWNRNPKLNDKIGRVVLDLCEKCNYYKYDKIIKEVVIGDRLLHNFV